jgi:hypothetical protein
MQHNSSMTSAAADSAVYNETAAATGGSLESEEGDVCSATAHLWSKVSFDCVEDVHEALICDTEVLNPLPVVTVFMLWHNLLLLQLRCCWNPVH